MTRYGSGLVSGNRPVRRLLESGRCSVTPRLLVSVRSVREAREAIAGGADVIDVKEPAHGSLGMAASSVIDGIVAVVAAVCASPPPTSAALGDASDWASHRSPPALPPQLKYAKLGLAGWSANTYWQSGYRDVCEAFDEASGRRLDWIAVAYADWEQASAPRPRDVIEAACEMKCVGVLFDTFAKQGRSLLDCLTPGQLSDYSQAVRSSGMTLALAGSLHQNLLPMLTPFQADIVGIRSAACRLHDRNGSVCGQTVAKFRESLRATVGGSCQSLDASASGGGNVRMRL